MINETPQPNQYLQRQRRLLQSIRDTELTGLVLNPGPSLTYLTGMHFHLSERPVVAVFTQDQPMTIILPELESAKTKEVNYPLHSFAYGEDPNLWEATFAKALENAGVSHHKLGVEPRQLRVLELNLLQAASPNTQFVSTDWLISSLRVVKDETEAENMRNAVHIAQDALIAALKSVQIGMTERELASELTMQLLRNGSDPNFPFSPIVSSGPNSANPHAMPSDRKLAPGDLLVIDWGAAYYGYISDLTRTFAIGDVDPEFKKIANLVQNANEAGRQACGPGVTAGSIDLAARTVIEQSGYGAYFFHRTGHGIGMEGHEEPYIRPGSQQEMLPGMTFTIEPGIYLPQRNGVRVEDNVMITTTGVECFSDLPRELITLPHS